ncbi:DUF262 domain-containing protein [Streptomyces sioyaensis]|uniref:DUF262 domain-containing protein n=1 Tax=Streptomyces sioyaensis TaxID=67364 RepID=UPI003795B413
MRADTVDLRRIFGRDIRYTVPLFQRPYVWNRDDNWSALWEDIRRTVERAEQAAESSESVPPHFLGAVVFNETSYLSSNLETREVIDGQQRLTTLQLLLLAARRSAVALEHVRSARLLGKFLENDEDLFDSGRDPDHRYKVWPTNADRDEFRSVMLDEGNGGRLTQAVAYFQREIETWLADAPEPNQRLEALVQTMREHLRLVIIDLEKHDDPQIVFETLNSRGTPLEHADLIKNLLFRRAEHAGADVGRLYEELWAPFDQDEWRTEQTTGRITRSRLDVFLTHWLTMRTRRDFTTSTLFTEFDRWLKTTAGPTEGVFSELARYAEIYDSIDQHSSHGVEGRFLYRMRILQTSTPLPLLLFLYGLDDTVLSRERRLRAIRAIDSYLVRRTILNLGNRDYNNVFRELVTAASLQPERADEAIITALAAMHGPYRHWPTDTEFQAALEHEPLYIRLYRNRLRILLEALEDALRTDHTEQLTAPDNGEHLGAKLTIEHIMPQSWREHWPAPANDPTEGADRDELIHTLGNLTLLTRRLNPVLGNAAWEDKRKLLGEYSLLRLTHGTLLNPPPSTGIGDWAAVWDERHIHARGTYLASVALSLWPSADDLLSTSPTTLAM